MDLPASAVALTVASSLSWSAFDVLRKRWVQRVSPLPLVVFLSLGQAPVFLALAAVQGRWAISAGYWGPALGSTLLNIAASVLFLESVRRSPLSTTVPLLAFTPVFSALAAIPLVGELPSARHWVGIALVVVGAFLLNAAWRQWASPGRLAAAMVADRGRLAMLLVALIWALSPIFDKLALAHAGVGVHGSLLSLGVAGGVALLLFRMRRLGELRLRRSDGPMLAWSVAFAAAALGLQLAALTQLFVAVFEGIKRGVGMSCSVLSGRLFFGEAVTVPKLVAVALMTAGVSLLF